MIGRPILLSVIPKNKHDSYTDMRSAAISSDGLDAVEAAVAEAFDTGAASDEVILNILSRRHEPPRPAAIVTLEDMALARPTARTCSATA